MSSRGRDGFTITSSAVASGLLALLLMVLLGLMALGQRRTATGTADADLQQQAMLLLYRLTQEVGEAREILLPLREDRVYPFVAFRTLEHEIVLYTFQKAARRIMRQVIDPANWQPSEERVVCADVDAAGFRAANRLRLVKLELTLGRQVGEKRETLPLTTGIGVRGW